ncbi:MAG TPA: phosphoribosylaminoimidazolesuccinocarboxamide synthase [Polyangiaceae bacterium]|nr:phosphoribosylaminoimidazolesuccinocarboxamide synthase [Polyangiaceae bacterium]
MNTDDRTDLLRRALAHPLESTSFDWGQRYTGKVRDNYTTADGRRLLVVTDRVSAFDRVLGTLPLKGQLLNFAAAWWFERTRDVADNHVLAVPDPNVLVARECQPLPVEMVVRAYLTGTTSTSIWVHYTRGERVFCGHRLPDGLRQHEQLPEPILTPSTKAAHGDHDVSASREQILQLSGMSAQHFDRAAELAMALFRRGQEVCAERGLILVDTKYELGVTPEGQVVVIDEIHTPDSSRFWYAESYRQRFAAGEAPESFDKEYLRRHLVELGFDGNGPIPLISDEVRIEASRRYLEAVERITGMPFQPSLEEPIERMRRTVGAYLAQPG